MVDEAVNNPARLGRPMKRAGERGESKWEQISWDEAGDIIEKRVRDAPGVEWGSNKSLRQAADEGS